MKKTFIFLILLSSALTSWPQETAESGEYLAESIGNYTAVFRFNRASVFTKNGVSYLRLDGIERWAFLSSDAGGQGRYLLQFEFDGDGFKNFFYRTDSKNVGLSYHDLTSSTPWRARAIDSQVVGRPFIKGNSVTFQLTPGSGLMDLDGKTIKDGALTIDDVSLKSFE